MNRKRNLLLPLLVPLGFAVGWEMRKRWGIHPTSSLREDAELFARWLSLLRLPIVFFCSGFTVFAFGVCAGGIFLASLVCGTAGNDPITPLALLARALTLAVDTAIGMASVTHRASLRTLAPTAEALIRSAETRRFTFGFLLACALLLGIAAAGGSIL